MVVCVFFESAETSLPCGPAHTALARPAPKPVVAGTGHTDGTGDDDDPAGVVVQEVEEEDGPGPELDEDALEGEAPEVLLPLGRGFVLLC